MTSDEEIIFLSTLSGVKDEYSACCAASLIAQINAMKTLIKTYNPTDSVGYNPNAVYWTTVKSDVEYLLKDREQLLTEALNYLSTCAKHRQGKAEMLLV